MDEYIILTAISKIVKYKFRRNSSINSLLVLKKQYQLWYREKVKAILSNNSDS